MCVPVCVCVYEREGERKKEREGGRHEMVILCAPHSPEHLVPLENRRHKALLSIQAIFAKGILQLF